MVPAADEGRSDEVFRLGRHAARHGRLPGNARRAAAIRAGHRRFHRYVGRGRGDPAAACRAASAADVRADAAAGDACAYASHRPAAANAALKRYPKLHDAGDANLDDADGIRNPAADLDGDAKLYEQPDHQHGPGHEHRRISLRQRLQHEHGRAGAFRADGQPHVHRAVQLRQQHEEVRLGRLRQARQHRHLPEGLRGETARHRHPRCLQRRHEGSR